MRMLTLNDSYPLKSWTPSNTSASGLKFRQLQGLLISRATARGQTVQAFKIGRETSVSGVISKLLEVRQNKTSIIAPKRATLKRPVPDQFKESDPTWKKLKTHLTEVKQTFQSPLTTLELGAGFVKQFLNTDYFMRDQGTLKPKSVSTWGDLALAKAKLQQKRLRFLGTLITNPMVVGGTATMVSPQWSLMTFTAQYHITNCFKCAIGTPAKCQSRELLESLSLVLSSSRLIHKHGNGTKTKMVLPVMSQPSSDVSVNIAKLRLKNMISYYRTKSAENKSITDCCVYN